MELIRTVGVCIVVVLQLTQLSILGGLDMVGTTLAIVVVAIACTMIGVELGQRKAESLKKRILEAKRLAQLKKEIESEE